MVLPQGNTQAFSHAVCDGSAAQVVCTNIHESLLLSRSGHQENQERGIPTTLIKWLVTERHVRASKVRETNIRAVAGYIACLQKGFSTSLFNNNNSFRKQVPRRVQSHN